MKTPTSEDLLCAWEMGRSQNLPLWALHILSLVCPEPEWDKEKLAKLTIGQRDALLLELRERCFGGQIVAVTPCPKCGEENELVFDVSDIRVDPVGRTPEIRELKVRDWEIQFRPLTTEDLLSLKGSDDAMSTLLRRCILVARNRGIEVLPEDMNEEIARAVSEEMSRADPQADVQLALSCASCGNHWLVIFDIVSFLKREMDLWANRILQDVHALASAYGWSEREILSMSHPRRQIYLELVG